MKVIKETKEVFGVLQTEFGYYKMLAKHPNKHDVPWYFKDIGILSFFVVDADGFAKNILVSGNFIIKPLSEEAFVTVYLLVEDDGNIKVEESEELPF